MLYETYVQCLAHIVKISDSINDGWKLEKYQEHVYLVKTVTQTIRNQLNISECQSYSDDQAVDSQSADVPSVTLRKWEYHVVYSLSYNIPVLYFNVWKSTGELLTLDELWDTVNINHQQHILNNKWFTLTQQDHPYLFRPFFFFHPCETNQFLKCFDSTDNNLIITWLSSIGQIIWLEMDQIYAKHCKLH